MSASNHSIYPKPPKALDKLTFKNILKFIGPGAIIASVTIGSGELVWASRSGAIFGTALMWAFLAAGIFKGLQVYSSTRYITLTGVHPISAWNRTPWLKWWFPVFLIAIPTIFNMPILFSGISETIGFYTIRLLGISSEMGTIGPWDSFELYGNASATVILLLCFLLSVSTGLKVLEKISIAVLATLIGCLLISAILLQPNVLEIIKGLVPGMVPEFEPWVNEKYGDTIASRTKWAEMALYLTAVGGGTYDYLGYVGLIRDKKWGLAGRREASKMELEDTIASNSEQLRNAKKWLRAPMMDTTSSFFFVTLVTLLFVVMGASVLHPVHEIPSGNDLLHKQEGFLSVVHPYLTLIYRFGVFFAFIGTLYGAFEIYRHSVLEVVRAVKPKSIAEGKTTMWRRLTNVYCVGFALLLIWLPQYISGNIVDRMVLGAVIGGALTCGLWCYAMLIIDKVHLPKALRMGNWLKIGVVLAGTVLTYLGMLSLIDYFN
nr:Nramp family divalent metal transporter [Allomuricauda sp.]